MKKARQRRAVALAEIKDDLSKYLRPAEDEEIVITRHGRAAGVLIGFGSEEDWFDYLNRVARSWQAQSHLHSAVHFVYIVRCADGTLYTGYARDPRERETVHNRGRGARYTAGRRPVCLVYSEAFTSLSDALKREHQLKRWSRAKKEALLGRAVESDSLD